MDVNFDFLSSKDESEIKKAYETEKRFGRIDKDIVEILDALNAIEGLATLYSCQGHPNKPRSYIVIKFKQTLIESILVIIDELLEEYADLRVDCEYEINFTVDDVTTTHKAIVLRGTTDYSYMDAFLKKLQ